MIKKTFIALALSLGLSLSTSLAWAEEIEVDCVADPTNEACIVTTNDYGVMPISETDGSVVDDNSGQLTDCLYESSACPTYGESAQTSNDSDSTSSNGDEATDEGDEEEATELQMWTVYVSLGALGAAVLVFIILNLFGRKRK